MEIHTGTMVDPDFYPAHYRAADKTYQSVEAHSFNVAKMAAQYGRQAGLKAICELAGLLHDLGKFSEDFKSYILQSIEAQEAGLLRLKSDVDHGKNGASLVLDRYHQGNEARKITAEILAMVICYHHGGMEDYISPDMALKLKERTEKKDKCHKAAVSQFLNRVADYDQLDHLFDAAQHEILLALKPFNGRPFREQKFALHLIIKYIYSCVIDADRYDSYLFEAGKEDEGDEAGEENSSVWQMFDNNLQQKEAELQSTKPRGAMAVHIKGLRYDIWKQCSEFGMKEPGIYTLTVPTGGGKTFSVLRFAINHALAHNKKKIIFIVPYLSILEQNAGQVKEALKETELILEHHSNVCLPPDRDNEQLETYRLLTERWDSPVIFTTMVQFLNTFFASGTGNLRRMHSLTDAILIFDEIQALPVKCISLFNETAKFLTTFCRDTVILCSATQPTLGNTENALEINGEMIADVREKFRQFKRMEVKDWRQKRRITVEQLAAFAWEKAQSERSILIILNTKKTAEAVYRQLKAENKSSDTNFRFLSTNLCPEHRRRVIRQMKQELEDGERVICVSTQLIEAGVDVSFQCVMRHLAGMDSIAQAAGRGNRHGEDSIKFTYIFELEEERLGSLKEIELGEQHSREVLDAFRREPQAFDRDLLSTFAMDQYYRRYFGDETIKGYMDYPVKNENSSIFKMLSAPKVQGPYIQRFGENCPFLLDFQLRTASRYFQVIDDCAYSVVVPYGMEGEALIRKMERAQDIQEKKALLKQAQQYSVNISENTFHKLEKERRALRFLEETGVWVLDKAYYHEELGVVEQGGEMEMLDFIKLT